MIAIQEQFDDAMFAFGTGDYDTAIAGFRAILDEQPDWFEAQLALGMARYRKGDYTQAIAEGHKAERLRPDEPRVHTNLSLFYVKVGDKAAAEHHGLRARVASWKDNMAPPSSPPGKAQPDALGMASPKPEPIRLPPKFPEMPWKKKPAGS
jgi:tetratricopeptide (TPR) repeat protein